MGGRAEGLACADPGARTPIGASRNLYCLLFILFLEKSYNRKIEVYQYFKTHFKQFQRTFVFFSVGGKGGCLDIAYLSTWCQFWALPAAANLLQLHCSVVLADIVTVGSRHQDWVRRSWIKWCLNFIKEKVTSNSASADGGPRSGVCACETLRSAPTEKLGTFLRKMKAYGWLYRQNCSSSEVINFWWNPSVRVNKNVYNTYSNVPPRTYVNMSNLKSQICGK